MMRTIRRSIRYCLIACGTACLTSRAMAIDLVVDPVSSNSAPNQYRTISAAVAALQPGDHLTIAAGLYRESIVLPRRNWNVERRTLIEGRGEVIIDAADIVTGWKSTGDDVFYRDWPAESAQVIVNGNLLTQIGGTVFGGYPVEPNNTFRALLINIGGIWPGRINGGVNDLVPNSFYYDATAKRLYVRTTHVDLNRQLVEVSTRAHGLLAQNVEGLDVKNLTFRWGNTSPTGRNGFVTISGRHVTVDKVRIQDADSVGLEVEGDDDQVSNSSATRCGQLGMKARGARMHMTNNQTNYNNTRGFNKWWEAGGIKFVGNHGLIDSVIVGHIAIGNHGDGIWFDWGNRNNVIENSVTEYNSGFGIQYEASSGAAIKGNRVIGNSQRGIYLPQSSYSTVQQNLVAANGLEGIAIVAESRVDRGGMNLDPVGNKVIGNVIAWNDSALTVPGTPYKTEANCNVFIGQGTQLREFDSWANSYNSFTQWKHQTGLDEDSIQVNIPIDPAFAIAVKKRQINPNLNWVDQVAQPETFADSCELEPPRPARFDDSLGTKRAEPALTERTANIQSRAGKARDP